jgi:PAS domain S-box-containing protein
MDHTVFTLQDCEDRYEQLIKSMPVAFYTTDAQGYITSFNEAAVMLWGRTPEPGKDQWTGSWKMYRTDGSPLSPEHSPMAITLREARAVTGEYLIVECPDGTRRYVAVHPKPVLNGACQVTGGVNMLIDMTAIKESELVLKESETRLRLLTDSLEEKVQERTNEVTEKGNDIRRNEERYYKMIEEVEDYAIILLDKEGVILNWNKGAEKIKRYREEEIVGKKFHVFYLPEDQADKRPERLMEQARKTGKATHEGWRVRKDGTTFWGNIVITALHDAQNNIIGYSKVTRDLTERKTAEDKLKQYANELEFQNKELQQFAFAAAHDMKEPIRKVQFYLTSVLEGAGNDLPEKEKTYLVRSEQAAVRMNGLIDDLLAYSKISAATDQFGPVDLNVLLNEAIQLHQDTIERAQAVVTTDVLPVISGVSFQIRQLFDNLVGNALKYYHPQRLLRLTVTYRQVPLPLEGMKAGSAVLFHEISFKDNGIGFEQEYAEKIFDMFQRLHTKDAYAGTGIGLAICKKIIQNHKGEIRAVGEPGSGSSFIIYIPCNNGGH